MYVSDEFKYQQNEANMQMDFIKQSSGFDQKAGLHALNTIRKTLAERKGRMSMQGDEEHKASEPFLRDQEGEYDQ